MEEMEHLEAAEHAHREGGGHGAHLGGRVAITIALLATFLAICKIKGDNVVQQMQRTQVDRLDQWSFYQARNIREEVGKAALAQLTASSAAVPEASRRVFEEPIKTYEALVADQEKKKDDVRKAAEADEKTYETLEYRHDQFDLCDAAIAMAISILAITALTGRAWLYWISLVPAAGGVLMGLAGLFGWAVHPDFLVRWIG